jgi:hypothetical protein
MYSATATCKRLRRTWAAYCSKEAEAKWLGSTLSVTSKMVAHINKSTLRQRVILMEKLNEPKWKNDLVKTIWEYARQNGLVTHSKTSEDPARIIETLPRGLGNLILLIRGRCDRCGKNVEQELVDYRSGFARYQCCWVHTETEDYCPNLCLDCHNELKQIRPHETVSV